MLTGPKRSGINDLEHNGHEQNDQQQDDQEIQETGLKITRRQLLGIGLPRAAAITGLHTSAADAQQDKPQYGGHLRIGYTL